MQHVIPEKYQDLLQQKTVAALGTLMADGSPQVTPVWFDHQKDEVWVNTASGRQKHLNVQRDPRVIDERLDHNVGAADHLAAAGGVRRGRLGDGSHRLSRGSASEITDKAKRELGLRGVRVATT